MRILATFLAFGLLLSCKKKEDDQATLKVMPQLLKLPNTSASLRPKFNLISADGATAQSFTPTSIRISLVDIALVDEEGVSGQIYACDAQSAAGCLLEVSKLKDLEDALNAKAVALRAANYVKVKASFCGSNDNNFQLVEVTGSTTMGGKTYITDTSAGIKEGVAADATPVQYKFHGCASSVTLQKPVNVELSAEQKKAAEEHPDDTNNDAYTKADADVSIRLLFDSYDFAMMGDMTNDSTKQLVAYGHASVQNIAFNDDEDAACKGSKTGLFICAQRTAIYATDAAAPTIERYAIALKDSDSYEGKNAIAVPGSVAYTALVRNDEGTPVAAYTRRSVDYGTEFNRSVNGDEDYVGFGVGIIDNGDGSYKLSRGQQGQDLTYGAFKAEDHEGKLMLNLEEVSYKATRIP